MCQFISAVEKGKKVFFLTYDQIYNTPRGDALREWSASEDDLIGHGAIRFYYDLEGGVDKEYTDFSDPANFPLPIVEAIKRGKMRGLGNPPGLLTDAANKAYQEAIAPIFVAWREAINAALRAKSDATFKVKEEAIALAEKALQKKSTVFWDLFAIPENRNPLWR